MLSNKAKSVSIGINGKIEGELKEFEADYLSVTEELKLEGNTGS